MRSLTTLALLVIPFVAASQFNDTTNYFTTLTATGIINNTNERDAYLLNNGLRFSTYHDRISFNSHVNFIFGKLNNAISNRDLVAAIDFNVFHKNERVYLWGLASFEKSFSLKINGRGQAGAGIGYLMLNAPNAVINISNGPLYEYSDIVTAEGTINTYETIRNSLRVKVRFLPTNNLTLEGTNFLQHAIDDRHDYIIRSNTSLSYKIFRWLSFTTTVNFNKLSATERENLLINFGLTFERYF